MFLVVNCSSAYNAILGHSTLNSWNAVTQTYHLLIKFSTEYGVGEVRGDQVAACECYIAMLKMNDHLQTMCIEEQWTVAEPLEVLEEITLDDSRPDQTTKIDTLASTSVRQVLTTFLNKNQDIFAQNHEDMSKIDPSIVVHKLNMSPSFSPIRQKKKKGIRSGMGQGHSRRGLQVTGSKIYTRSILSQLVGQCGNG